jgi:hypothetical protein
MIIVHIALLPVPVRNVTRRRQAAAGEKSVAAIADAVFPP